MLLAFNLNSPDFTYRFSPPARNPFAVSLLPIRLAVNEPVYWLCDLIICLLNLTVKLRAMTIKDLGWWESLDMVAEIHSLG
jgi:hypothetical protein